MGKRPVQGAESGCWDGPDRADVGAIRGLAGKPLEKQGNLCHFDKLY